MLMSNFMKNYTNSNEVQPNNPTPPLWLDKLITKKTIDPKPIFIIQKKLAKPSLFIHNWSNR